MRKTISSGSPWEPLYGYSRAVRSGNFIAVAGTTSGKDSAGGVIGRGDPYLQMKAALKKIEDALATAGASFSDVVRTRTFVTDISYFEAVAKAHREAFGDVLPAATLVAVSALVDPELLVEVEVDAVVGEGE